MNAFIRYSLGEQITAFSTTRYGGISKGNYASMNCTPYTGDDTQAVQSNQRLLCTALHCQPSELIIPYQTHGTQVLTIDQPFLTASAEVRHNRLQGIDALVTNEPKVCLCISTADCIPLLLYDHTHQAIAAIHAGWRGTVNRIVGKTIQTMQELYHTQEEDLHAVIGPGISLEAFEVGNEVYEAFHDKGFPMNYISRWNNDTHKWHIDLPAANMLQLLDFGVPQTQIHATHICTYTQHEDFFSARRLGIKSGRILSGIRINPLF